jgi:hypothetical protein
MNSTPRAKRISDALFRLGKDVNAALAMLVKTAREVFV